jgi:hypothetical protein
LRSSYITGSLNTISLDYGVIVPGAKRVKKILVESRTNTTLEFVWEIVAEDQNYKSLVPPLSASFSEYDQSYHKLPFSILPDWGVFTPELSKIPFEVHYAPGAVVDSVSYVARLFIKGVPQGIAELAIQRMGIHPRKQLPLVKEEIQEHTQIAVADFLLSGSVKQPEIRINPGTLLYPGSLIVNEV